MGRIKFKVKYVSIKAEVDLKEKQKQRRKERLKKEVKDFRREVKEFKNKMISDKSVLAEEPVMVSRYPANYLNDPLMKDKTIMTPLIGERDFVHAKIPKFVERESSQRNIQVQNQEQNQIQQIVDQSQNKKQKIESLRVKRRPIQFQHKDSLEI